jgi:hypothetical protein
LKLLSTPVSFRWTVPLTCVLFIGDILANLWQNQQKISTKDGENIQEQLKSNIVIDQEYDKPKGKTNKEH